MDILFWTIAILLMLIGIAGTVLPVIPGIPMIFGGIVLAAWIDDFQRISLLTLFVLAIPTLFSIVIDYIAPGVSARGAGASKAGVAGALIGTILGIFTGFWGLLFMPLAGAAIGEYLARRDLFQAGKVGTATWLGLIIAGVLKVGIAFMMVGLFITALLI